jgi:hypothetical protein
MKIDGIEFSESQIEALANKGLLQIGQKHDTSGTTPTAQALHGPFPGNNNQFGVFSYAGVRPGMFNATTRVDSVGKIIPLLKSDLYNEIIEIMTGVTAGSGNNDVSACATAPKAGDLKTCQQTYAFGIIHIGTRIEDVTQVGLRKNRADVPRDVYNNASMENPWLPQVPGIEGLTTTTSRLRAAMYTLGIEMERNISPVHFVGVAGTESNTYRGVARQWNGLDRLIKTGYTDAVTQLACARADSQVVSYNAEIDGSDAFSRDIVEAMTDTYFGATDLASNLQMAGVQYALVMRPDLFRAMTEQWACTYATYRCAGPDAGNPVGRTATEVYNTRVDMFNNQYLLIEGERVPVILDNTIAREVVGNNHYKSDVYGVALSWNGMPLLFGEYFDMANSEAEEYVSAFGMDVSETTTVNDGLYRVFKRVTKGCYEYDFFARVRLILDAPFLSFRLDDIRYKSYFRQVDPIPGTSYHVNGGVSYRS